MVRKLKLFITGSDGTLAGYARAELSEFDLFLANKKILDITIPKDVNKLISEIKPDMVLHFAAKTDVDECQKQPYLARMVNTLGTKNIAEACAKYHVKLCYISTAAVFDGSKSSYVESDATNPVNEYGKSKLEGEINICNLCDDYLIVRIPWLIGGGLKEKKFISYIINQIRSGSDLHVVNDTFGNLAYAPYVLKFIKTCILENKEGLYHFGSKSECSRFDIAGKLIELVGKKVTLTPVPSSFFHSHFFSPRPKHEVIYSEKQSLVNTWEKMLEEYYRLELIKLV